MDRQTACKVRISDLLKGAHITGSGWEPNYVKLENGRKVSRVNLICTVIDKSQAGLKSITVDDGTGKIEARSFEQDFFSSINVGDTILLIGKPRIYSGGRYLVPEIVKKVENKTWLEVRKRELEKQPEETRIEEKEKTEGIEEEAVQIIKELDKGEGVNVEEIIRNIPDGEEKIKRLLEQGEIFEIRPGKVKVLE